MEFSLAGAVKSTYIEVDYLNHVSMPRFRGHPHLVQKNLQHALLVGTVESGFVDLVIHYLYCHALVGGQSDAELHSESREEYCEKRPTPSLNKTRYF